MGITKTTVSSLADEQLYKNLYSICSETDFNIGAVKQCIASCIDEFTNGPGFCEMNGYKYTVTYEPEKKLLLELNQPDCINYQEVLFAICRYRIRFYNSFLHSDENSCEFSTQISHAFNIFFTLCDVDPSTYEDGVMAAVKKEQDLCLGVVESDDGVYEGELVFQLGHGQGRYKTNRGMYYEGRFESGRLKKGFFIRSGVATVKGDFYKVEGCLQSDFCEVSFEDGRQYTGGLKRGKLNGNGTLKTVDSKTVTGEFKDGEPINKWTVKLENGDVYKGSIDYKSLTGEGTLSRNGRSMSGSFKNGRLIGKGEIVWDYVSGVIYEGEIKHNLPSGKGVLTTPDRKYEGTWNSGYFLPDEIPSEFQCSLTFELMTDPIRIPTQDGSSTCVMDRSALYKHLSTEGGLNCRCPYTNKPLSLHDINGLEVDFELQQRIAKWRSDNIKSVTELFNKFKVSKES